MSHTQIVCEPSAPTTFPHIEMSPYSSLNLLELPLEVMEKIFSYLNYETISKIRLVCKPFNEISSSLLNSAFQRLQTLMLQRFQKIKAQMPRRESARRKHPLARESDIIETLHMRLTLLQMSFGKHIERKHCCFFAGEILDEVYRILRYVKTTPSLARAYKVTDELFDLSTMAMEYFKERIEPTLPEITYFGSDFLDFNSFSNSPGSSASPTGSVNQSHSSDDVSDPAQSTTLKKKLKRFRQVMKRHDKRQTSMLRDLKRCRSRLTEQEKQIKEMSNRLEDCTKKAEESSCKFNAVLQELNKCKTELQYWRSKSPANQTCSLCGKIFSSSEETRSLTGENLLDEMASQSSGLASYKTPELLYDKPSTSNFIPISDHAHRDLTIDYFETENSASEPTPFVNSQLSQVGLENSSSTNQSLPLKKKWNGKDDNSEKSDEKKMKLSDCNSSDGDSEVAILSACFDEYPVNNK